MGGSGSKTDSEAAKKAEEDVKAKEAVEAAKKAEEDRKAKEAAEAAKKAEEEQKAKEAAEAAKKAEEEQKANEAAKAAKHAEQELKAKEAAEAAKKAEEEQKAKEAAEAARKAEEEQKAKEAAEAAKKAEEALKAEEAAEAAKKAEEERKSKESAEAAKKADEELKAKEADEVAKKAEEAVKTEEVAEAAKTAAEELNAKNTAEAANKAEEEPKVKEVAEAEVFGPMEEPVRRAAAMLLRLQPKQRPATAERLQTWLRPCCSAAFVQPLPGGPAALAAALHAQLARDKVLQAALQPFVLPAVGAAPDDSPAVRDTLRELLTAKDAFISQPLAWRACWLKRRSKKGSATVRTKPPALLAELRARGLVSESTERGEGGDARVAYDEAKLLAVPKPVPRGIQPTLSDEVVAEDLASMWEAAKDTLSMPVLCKEVHVPLPKGRVGKVNYEAFKKGGQDQGGEQKEGAAKTREQKAVKRQQAAKRLNDRARAWAQEAARDVLKGAQCSVWAKACIKGPDVVVTVELAPSPPSEEEFVAALKRVVEKGFIKYDVEVGGLLLDKAFYGLRGLNLRHLELSLKCSLQLERASGKAKFALLPDCPFTEADFRKIMDLLASKTVCPVRCQVDPLQIPHLLGKGGRSIRDVMTSTETRLQVDRETGIFQGWLSAMAIPAGSTRAEILQALEEKAKTASDKVKAAFDVRWDIAKHKMFMAEEAKQTIGPGSSGRGGCLKLERTFSNEFRVAKMDRQAKRDVNKAKKVLAASRRQGGGGRARRPGAPVPRGMVSEVMQLKREVIAGFKALGEIASADNTPEADLEDQREELEQSMRECCALAVQVLEAATLGPHDGNWKAHQGASAHAGKLAEAFQGLLDPERFRKMSCRQLAESEAVEEISGSSVWPRLDDLAKVRAQAPQKEGFMHVRKGKPAWKAEERGGRYKPGEASSAAGTNVEEGFKAIAEPGEPIPEEEEAEDAAAGEAPAEDAAPEAAAGEEAKGTAAGEASAEGAAKEAAPEAAA